MGLQEDWWYAVSRTRVVHAPRRTLETFGTTKLRYHLLSELMDDINQVRVREGYVYSERPQIVTASSELLENFGDKAREYARAMAAHGELVPILKYGLQFRKDALKEHRISDSLANAAQRVCDENLSDDDNHSAVIIGADELWEVSLLKFTFDYVQRSAATNLQDLRQASDRQIENEVEAAFAAAWRDPAKLNALGAKLQEHDLFEKYEDRFYALLQRQP